jgi:flagellar hook-associated protein 1 FlgK
MPLMGSLYLGTSGLTVSQNALNTTAHNMSNVDTSAYTRQQVQLTNSIYNTISKTQCATSYTQLGLGVTYSQTRQVRDYFLDLNYRRESGRSAFYDNSVSTMDEMEDVLGESSNGQSFSESVSNLWTAVQELDKDPTTQVNQNLFVTRCYEFITNANAVYNSLCDYQTNMNATVKTDTEKINSYAEKLEDLNNQIVKIEAGGFEHANDLRDERNSVLDELSKLADISWDENDDGYVSVQLEGTDLVKGGVINEIGLYQDKDTGFYTPYWKSEAKYETQQDGTESVIASSVNDAKLFDLTRTISSDLNTDIGGLKSVLLARGDHNATYNDLDDSNGYYNKNISQSIVMNTEAEFDQLIHNITTKINSIMSDAATTATAANSGSTYMRDSDGNILQMFNEITSGGGMSCGNIEINSQLRSTPSLLKFVKDDGESDNVTTTALKAAFEDSSYTLNPNVATKVTFNGYYEALVSQVSNSGKVYKAIQSSQESTLNAISSAREQIVGVSSDEEMTNMVMYQNAYNAASRYINVVNAMLENLLEKLS